MSFEPLISTLDVDVAVLRAADERGPASRERIAEIVAAAMPSVRALRIDEAIDRMILAGDLLASDAGFSMRPGAIAPPGTRSRIARGEDGEDYVLQTPWREGGRGRE